MPTLKDLGIELQSFAPIPNSIIVGRFSFGELDVDNLRDIANVVYDAFKEQDVGNCNAGCGWSKSPEEAWEAALKYHRKYHIEQE